jgi:hypothetical protein
MNNNIKVTILKRKNNIKIPNKTKHTNENI